HRRPMISYFRRLLPLLRARGFVVVLLACVVGAVAGAFVRGMGLAVQILHTSLFSLPIDTRLSGLLQLSSWRDALVPIGGGALMGLSVMYLRLRHFRPLIDHIEANALHGGRMSLTDTLVIAIQTIISSGF